VSRVEATAVRREAIITAALECFTDHGYEATTIDDIVRKSRASVGSIYHHFADKRGLAAEIYSSALADIIDGAIALLDRDLPTEAMVREGVAYYLAWVEANPAEARFLFVQRETDVRRVARPDVKRLNKRFFSRVFEWLDDARRSGELREAPDQIAITLWIGPSQEFARMWLSRKRRDPLTAATAQLAEGAWRALRP
jgi:AcrR family transcriptional regulator